MRHATARAYRPAPVETPEPARCECSMGDAHSRACAGIPDAPLELVAPLVPCDVCGGPAPCASCAVWACPPVGTAIVCTIRPLDAKPVKTFKGTVTRIDPAELADSEGNGGWPAGVVVSYPKMRWKKNTGVSVFHAWPSLTCEAVAP